MEKNDLSIRIEKPCQVNDMEGRVLRPKTSGAGNTYNGSHSTGCHNLYSSIIIAIKKQAPKGPAF